MRFLDYQGTWISRWLWLSVNGFRRHVEGDRRRVCLWGWIKYDLSVLGRRYRYFGIRTSELMANYYLFFLACRVSTRLSQHLLWIKILVIDMSI